jgi:flavin-dependent dehydrogenase
MRDIEVIAILGGGPAGAMAATTLAADGRKVVLVDEKLVWEKPCGGGVTQRGDHGMPGAVGCSEP